MNQIEGNLIDIKTNRSIVDAMRKVIVYPLESINL